MGQNVPKRTVPNGTPTTEQKNGNCKNRRNRPNSRNHNNSLKTIPPRICDIHKSINRSTNPMPSNGQTNRNNRTH